MRGGRWCVMWALVAAGAAWAQEPAKDPQEPAIPPPKEPWALQFEPTIWYGAAGGKVTLPGSPEGVDSTKLEDVNLEDPKVMPGGELYLYDETWRFMISGYRLESDDRITVASGPGQTGPVTYAAGDVLDAALTFTVVEAAVMKQIALPDSISGASGKEFAARLDILGGIRFYDVSFDFSAPSGSTSADQFFAHPIFGAKLSMEVIEGFTIDTQVDIGGIPTGSDSLSFGYDIIAGFIWRPTPNFGLQIGYRDLAFFLRSGPEGDRFEFDGAIQGLFAGGVIRF